EQLSHLRKQLIAIGQGPPLRIGTERPYYRQWIRKKPRGDFLSFSIVDPILGDEHIKVLAEKQSQRLVHAETKHLRCHGSLFRNRRWGGGTGGIGRKAQNAEHDDGAEGTQLPIHKHRQASA